MIPSLPKAIDLFQRKVNLLIIDDNDLIRDSLSEMFSSPLFHHVSAGSLDTAHDAIGFSSTGWHCWIVDIDLGQGNNGLSLLQRFPEFHYSIVLSGLGSMTRASEAISLGARTVIDKDPATITNLFDEVCRTAALGFVLGGKQTPYLDTFLLLQDPKVTSVEAWAARAGMTPRQLYRTCEVHPPLTPFYALALYRSVYFLLRESGNSYSHDDPLGAASPTLEGKTEDESWMEYVVGNYKG